MINLVSNGSPGQFGQTTFMLWKVLPGTEQTAEEELNAQRKGLQWMVFEHLLMPFSPAIKFRQAQAIDDILAKLHEESD